MFYLQTYHGTQVENVCTACILKPSDEVCATCDFDLYDASLHDTDVPNSDSDISSSGQRRRRAATSSSGGSTGSSSTSSISSLGLSKECQACVVSESKNLAFFWDMSQGCVWGGVGISRRGVFFS